MSRTNRFQINGYTSFPTAVGSVSLAAPWIARRSSCPALGKSLLLGSFNLDWSRLFMFSQTVPFIIALYLIIVTCALQQMRAKNCLFHEPCRCFNTPTTPWHLQTNEGNAHNTNSRLPWRQAHFRVLPLSYFMRRDERKRSRWVDPAINPSLETSFDSQNDI